MTERIRTLILEGNGFGLHAVLIDTVVRGILGIRRDASTFPDGLRKTRLARTLLGQRYEALSYVMDWREAFRESLDLDIDVVNINNLVAYYKALVNIKDYSLIVILHSAAGDSMDLLLKTAGRFSQRRCRLVMFIGNEYLLLDEKIRFIQEAEVDYICSQLPERTAQWLYRECEKSRVLAMPPALKPDVYYSRENNHRPIDLGFRGTRYPNFIGDSERNDMLDFFQRNGVELGLNVDFGYRTIRREDWGNFLRDCRAVIGAEAGTYVLDARGQTITAAHAYQKEHPDATLEEIRALFFKNPPEHVSGKCISSRHFEPIGTKTCQVLLEGEYNGILKGDEHFISLKKDYSNLEEVIRKLKDEDFRRAMAEHAYQYVLSEHTYAHRVQSLISTLKNDGL